jgi:hypothetical protein
VSPDAPHAVSRPGEPGVKLEITRTEGLRNDLLLRLDRGEIETAWLSLSDRDRLRELPGMLRHRPATAEEEAGIAGAKVPIETHLRRMGVVDEAGHARRRAVVISNRNLGTNHGHVAWQRDSTPPIFRVAGDPCRFPSYSCLTVRSEGRIGIETLRFDFEHERVVRVADGTDVGHEIEWATFGQRVLRAGRVVGIDELAGRFYDARHLLAFDPYRPEGEKIRQALYQNYPAGFEASVRRAWREQGVPRARYVHNAVGTSDTSIVVLQREGTVEEIGEALRQAGADDGIILDNGGSVACWVWWANQYRGGLVSPTVDYRPPGTSAIAFVLRGPMNVTLPGGSVSYSVF